MVDRSISGKKWFPAAGVFVRAAEQRLCEIKQRVCRPGIAEIDQAGER